MRALVTAMLVPLLAASAGCGAPCSTEARLGLSVTAVDATTHVALCDATVTATRSDGTSMALPPFPPGACRYGLPESAGTWDVAVTAPGYLAGGRIGVVVPGDGCHVALTEVTVPLARP